MRIKTNGPTVLQRVKKHGDAIKRKQMDFNSVVAGIAQNTESNIESNLFSRFPEAVSHWSLEFTLNMSSNEVGFSIKLKDTDEYGRILKENYSSEIDDVIQDHMRQAIALVEARTREAGFSA